jgi:hypothetical protein
LELSENLGQVIVNRSGSGSRLAFGDTNLIEAAHQITCGEQPVNRRLLVLINK